MPKFKLTPRRATGKPSAEDVIRHHQFAAAAAAVAAAAAGDVRSSSSSYSGGSFRSVNAEAVKNSKGKTVEQMAEEMAEEMAEDMVEERLQEVKEELETLVESEIMGAEMKLRRLRKIRNMVKKIGRS